VAGLSARVHPTAKLTSSIRCEREREGGLRVRRRHEELREARILAANRAPVRRPFLDEVLRKEPEGRKKKLTRYN